MEKLCFIHFGFLENIDSSFAFVILSIIFMFFSHLLNKHKNKNDWYLTAHVTLVVLAAGCAVTSILIVGERDYKSMLLGLLFAIIAMISAFSSILITEKKTYLVSSLSFYFSVAIIALSLAL